MVLTLWNRRSSAPDDRVERDRWCEKELRADAWLVMEGHEEQRKVIGRKEQEEQRKAIRKV